MSARNVLGTFMSTGDTAVINFGESGAGVSSGFANFTADRGIAATGNASVRWNEALTRWEYGTVGTGFFPIGSGSPSPLTTIGDMLTHNGVIDVRLPAGLPGVPLVMDAASYPTWSPEVYRINEGQDDVTIVGTYAITTANKAVINFTISAGNQTAALLDATTVNNGWAVEVVNTSVTELLEIQNNGGGTLRYIPRGKKVRISLTDNSAANGVWKFEEVQKHNILYVAKAGGDYTSLFMAMASITDNTATNQYTIVVAPGVFTEITVAMKEYVSVVGSGMYSTIIQGGAALTQILICHSHSTLYGLGFDGSLMAVGSQGLFISSKTDVVVSDCKFDDCDLDVHITTASSAIVHNCIFSATNINVNEAIQCTNSDLTLHNNKFIFDGTTGSIIKTDFSNTASYVVSFNGDYFFTPAAVTVPEIGMRVSTGGNYIMDGVKFIGAMTGIQILNSGSTPRLQANLTAGEGVTVDLQHATMVGTLTGSFYDSPYGTITSPNINVNVSIASDDTRLNIGDVTMGTSSANTTDMRYLLMNEPTLGRISGGALTDGGGLNVAVAAGTGFIKASSSPDAKGYHVTWSGGSIGIPASSVSYIYITNAGVISSALAEPDSYANVLLGRVSAGGASIRFIDESPVNSIHAGNLLDTFNREGVKGVFANGCVTTGNASKQLQVTTGVYFFGTNRFAPTGSAFPLTFTYVRHSAGAWIYQTLRTTVDDGNYDDGVGLTPITAGYYAKSTLYVLNDGVNEQYFNVFAQAEYATLQEANAAALPTPPAEFEWGIVLIASIIVLKSNGIQQINDERRMICDGCNASGGTYDHGELTGLTDDDHTQYLPVDGTRAMSGDLNMGGNAITTVGNVDGVDVSDHSARHDPGGADALTTAAPAGSVSATSANTEGVATSFARSDHMHAFDETTVDHTNIQNIGVNTHANIDTHIASTTNPHSVTIAQVSPLTTDGDIMFYNGFTSTSTRLAIGAREGHTLVAFPSGAPGSKLAWDPTIYYSHTFYSGEFLSPASGDWSITVEAAEGADTNNGSLTVRAFDDTTEEGVGFGIYIRSNANYLYLRTHVRAETAPVAARHVGWKLYYRRINSGSAVPAWSSTALNDTALDTNEFFVATNTTLDLNALSMTSGFFQYEITRVAPASGTNLTGDAILYGINAETTT